MRILVLQLARFGDIYQTWPTLNALKRKHPDCDLHLLVRSRFKEAAADFVGITVHQLPTADILHPIFENGDEQEANEELIHFARPLINLRFDMIVNLSFSPTSSYLTEWLAPEGCIVRGYTRHSDGHLHIPDDTSSYFYAQVGIGRANRYHVTEIFAAVADVELSEADFAFAPVCATRAGIVIHLGASSMDKVYSPDLWVKVLRNLSADCNENLILVGSDNEAPLAQTVIDQVASPRLLNRVGSTTLRELVMIVSTAKLLIGADSAPVHIAALTGTPVLNLSSAKVNFWETGPLTAGSRVLYAEDLQAIPPQNICDEALAMLTGQGPRHPCAIRDNREQPFRLFAMEVDFFSWRLIEALYTGTPFPESETRADDLAFQRLFELAELGLQQLDRWTNLKTQDTSAQILDQVDALLPEVVKLNRRVEPMVQWFATQRLRIPPDTKEETLRRTRTAFQDFLLVTKVYRKFGDVGAEIKKAISLCQLCIPEMREYAFNKVQNSFQSLVSTLHELTRHSTKVGRQMPLIWSSVLGELNMAIERRDFIELADMLEWKLIPALQSELTEIETLALDVIS